MDGQKDKFETLVSQSQYTLCILGNVEQSAFEFVELAPLPAEKEADLTRRGFGFVGLIGLAGLTPRVALAVPLEPETISALSQSFCRLMERAIVQVEQSIGSGDGVAWLEKLLSLPDQRHPEEN